METRACCAPNGLIGIVVTLARIVGDPGLHVEARLRATEEKRCHSLSEPQRPAKALI